MITFNEFEKLFNPIIVFLDDSNNVNDALKTIFPSSYVVSELGNDLLDKYIILLASFLNVESDIIFWFVFDNDMGKNEYEYNDIKIDSLEKFWSVLII